MPTLYHFTTFFFVSPPSLCQFYVFLVFTCHNFVMFFHILLTPCANFVPFRNFFSVSPPSLCQFYVFLVFTCHNLVMFFIFYYIATLLDEKTAVIEYNIKSRDRLAKYVSADDSSCSFTIRHLSARGRYITPNTIRELSVRGRHLYTTYPSDGAT